MKINGFQKMTVLDYPKRVACTVFTAGCNLRCPFCHNASLVTHIDNSVNFDENEILTYLKKRVGILDGICITGGEPLLQPDIENFIAKVKEIGYSVKLDTNGCYPDALKNLIDKNLVDYVAMDIKNSKEKYALTVGLENFDISPIEKSVQILLNSNIDYEFRTTIVKEFHTPDDIQDIGVWIKGAKNYYLQNFVDSGDLICGNLSAVEKNDLYSMQQKLTDYVQNCEIRGI